MLKELLILVEETKAGKPVSKVAKTIVIKASTIRVTASNGGDDNYTTSDCRGLERDLKQFGTVLYTVNRTGADKEIQSVIALKAGANVDNTIDEIQDGTFVNGDYVGASEEDEFTFEFNPSKPDVAIKHLLKMIKDDAGQMVKYVILELKKKGVNIPEFDAMLKSIKATKIDY